MENEEKKLIKRTIFKKYIIIKLLAKGTFSKVFLGKNIVNKKLYAIKSENIFSNPQLLKDEAFILYNLKGFGIPEVITFGRSGNYTFLVQTLLGKSLKDIWIEKGKKLCLKDVCLIAKQTLDRIEFVHSKNYIHRDIKPGNFLVGNPDNSIIYLIDFGNARKYRSSKSGKHIQPFKSNRIFGTGFYISINASKGYEQSRRDDLESLGYMYIYLAKGELPWNRLKCYNKAMIFYNTLKLKINIPIEDLCKDLPNEFCDYMKYVKKLNFESKPDYEYLRSLFQNILHNNDIFSWMDNKCLTMGNYKANNALVKTGVTKNNSLLKQKYFNKKARTISDLYFFNLENQENDILKKIENISHDNKKKRELSINSTNGIKLEGIQNKNNNMNYFNNINIINNNSISKPDKNVDKYNIISFPKFMEYTPNFEQNNNIIFPNDNKNINNIKKDINNNNNINNFFNITDFFSIR